MATHTTSASLLMAQTRRFAAMQGDAESLLRKVAQEGLADCYRDTSGGISSKTLRRLGHPYARRASLSVAKHRGVKGIAPLLPINVQSGRLRRSFDLRKAGRWDWSIWNKAPYARWVLLDGGTRTTVGRGFQDRQVRRGKARMHGVLLSLKRQAARP